MVARHIGQLHWVMSPVRGFVPFPGHCTSNAFPKPRFPSPVIRMRKPTVYVIVSSLLFIYSAEGILKKINFCSSTWTDDRGLGALKKTSRNVC